MPRKDTQFKPGESGNPSGISKEKAQLRQAFEEFIAGEGRFDKYLERLDNIALHGTQKEALVAIRILLDKALGKDFHLETDDSLRDGLRKLHAILTGSGEPD